MSGSGRFCPRCGNPVDDDGFSAPDTRGNADAQLCRECYLEAIDLVTVPDRTTVHICTSCGAVRSNDEWETMEAADYTEVAIDAVADELRVHRDATDVQWAVEPMQRGPNELDLTITVTATVEGAPVEAARDVSVRIARETCPSCGRKAGDYYAGTVQIRGTERIPTDDEESRAVEIAHTVANESDDRDSFVTKVEERPEGVDIRVSSNKLAEQISNRVINELGGSVDTSPTLVTEDEEGEGVYRVAYAIRLPEFQPGDIIRTDTDTVLVLGDVRGRRLATGEEVSIDDDRKAAATRIGSAEDVIETTLVTVEDENAIQVLDPETAAAVTISRPPDLDVDRQTVPTFKTETGLYAIPDAVLKEVSA